MKQTASDFERFDAILREASPLCADCQASKDIEVFITVIEGRASSWKRSPHPRIIYGMSLLMLRTLASE